MPNYLWMVFCLMLSSCSQHTMPPSIATGTWTGYEPLYLARKLNMLSSQDARLVEYTSATQVMDALRDGAVEMGALSLDEALQLQKSGINVRVVLIMDYSKGSDALLAKPAFDSLASLKGHRIGVEDSAEGAYLLIRAIELAGMSVRDFDILHLDADEHESAYTSGKVDAIVTLDPIRNKLLATGARKLFDSADIPGEMMDVLVVGPELSGNHIEHLRRVLSAWFGALDFIHQQPEKAGKLMAGRTGMSEELTQKALQGIQLIGREENRKLLRSRPSLIGQRARQLARVMIEQNLAEPAELKPELLVDNHLLEKLYP